MSDLRTFKKRRRHFTNQRKMSKLMRTMILMSDMKASVAQSKTA
jgi:hypothetical protein